MMKFLRHFVFAIACLSVLWPNLLLAQGPSQLPYRFLLVISDQWEDPASYMVSGTSEFQSIVALLKTWGLPFEIMRLDQQRLDTYHTFDREGRPRYGTILWDASPVGLTDTGVELLQRLVKEYGVNLVVLGDAVAHPVVSDLAGLEYVSEYRLGNGLTIGADHFITRGLKDRESEFLRGRSTLQGSKVEVSRADVLANRGHLPFLTARTHGSAGRVVWLGVQRSVSQFEKQIVRDLLKRSLVWAQGYALYAEYPKSTILLMDDIGTSDRTFLPYWHYRTLDEEDIRQGLIEPLKRHNAVMVQDVNTGFVDRETRRILNPWKQRVTDKIDGKTVHDYVSGKRGLDAGVEEGVFEIASHGWTHMLPDLDSSPGPFWTAPMDGVGTLGWDIEFGDRLRGQEVPAILQKYHLERSLEYIQQDFGTTPLFVMAGGGGHSVSYPNNSQRIAAQVGFGLCSDFGPIAYLGRDLVVALQPIVQRISWAHDRDIDLADLAWTVDAPNFLIFHDRDVSMDALSVERLLTELGNGVRYMTANEYCGYLHARIERDTSDNEGVALIIHYDDHYCRYFSDHESTWTLHLADEMREAIKTTLPEKRTVKISKGLGSHSVRIDSGGSTKAGK